MTLLAVLVLAVGAVLAMLHIAFRPPALRHRTSSRAVRISRDTPMGRAVLDQAAGHDHDSGVVALHDGLDAFGARIALIREATEALDIQYYIWQRDMTGLVLLAELHQAALRGVRIRLLLDDNGIAGLDADLAALNALPTVEVRLFNPFILRRPKGLGFLFDFVRLNRRMHNKALIADGAATILGGRNIGDIYFAFGDGPHYLDTDVLAFGQVASDAGEEFDRYWDSRSAYPAEMLLPPAPDGLDRLQDDLRRALETPSALAYRQGVVTRPLVADLVAGELSLDWVPIRLISDDPAKGIGRARNRDLMFAQLMRMIASPDRSVDIISAYFVPGRKFTERLIRLVAEGRQVRILTNSQEATDVLVVHSAYVKYRPRLLAGGIRLYELCATRAQPREPRVPGASTRASLHSKTVSVDGERIFIGSFNFDPRSVLLNTEMGVLIDSPRLASEVSRGLDAVLPAVSYGPVRTSSGRIVWNQPAEGKPAIVHLTEPGTNWVQRRTLWLLGRLPIEWLL